LKRRVRDVIEPGRDLGHVDRDHKKEGSKTKEQAAAEKDTGSGALEAEKKCEDCQ
jgi:hypothetical protein